MRFRRFSLLAVSFSFFLGFAEPSRAGVTYAVFRTGSLYQPLPERIPVPGLSDQEPGRIFPKEWWSGAGLRRDLFPFFSVQGLFNYLRVRHRDLSDRDFSNPDQIDLNPGGNVNPEIFRTKMIDSISVEGEIGFRPPVEFFVQPWVGGGGAYYWVWSNDRMGGLDNRRTDRVPEYRITLGLDIKTSEKTKLLVAFRRHTLLLGGNDDSKVDNFVESFLNKDMYYSAIKHYPGWEIPSKVEYVSVTAGLCVGFR